MTRDWSKPGGLARWGWLWPAVDALCAAANLLMIVIGWGGLLSWMAAIVCGVFGVFAFRTWRDEARYDAARRRWLAAIERPWGAR